MGGGSTWTDGVVDASPAGGESGHPRPGGAAGRQSPPITGQKALPEGRAVPKQTSFQQVERRKEIGG